MNSFWRGKPAGRSRMRDTRAASRQSTTKGHSEKSKNKKKGVDKEEEEEEGASEPPALLGGSLGEAGGEQGREKDRLARSGGREAAAGLPRHTPGALYATTNTASYRCFYTRSFCLLQHRLHPPTTGLKV
ncbi:hypothetical protein E2C01_096557 [Portunus trituberculatus]|uniref:Uncharacterized protein n=1 Tax=Portunus trituberculatus TaxID=210409 RepID=A0A5B7K8J5_PORTR|nr:hypothetical protein [Portunus trituberculatus]